MTDPTDGRHLRLVGEDGTEALIPLPKPRSLLTAVDDGISTIAPTAVIHLDPSKGDSLKMVRETLSVAQHALTVAYGALSAEGLIETPEAVAQMQRSLEHQARLQRMIDDIERQEGGL